MDAETGQSGTDLHVDVLIDGTALRASLGTGESSVAQFRDALAQTNALLAERFEANVPVEKLVSQLALAIDDVIVAAWEHFVGANDGEAALVAVGGYGRGELHPHSDIDLMVLLDDSGDNQIDDPVSRFLTFLWDIGLEVGHSVRTVDDCEAQARADLTIVTTLMESRLLAGREDLFREMEDRIGPDRMWDSATFFQAKLDEQVARHRRYDDTAYNLEPNVKGSPGGLRDIQMIGWIARRHFGTRDLAG
ncbi:MAG: nucleotidyltransferase domain-containing protein, partial [Gammaproteobacteria bacterium]